MRIYRLGVKDANEEHRGYCFFAKLSEAKKAAEDAKKIGLGPEIKRYSYPVTAKGMIRALGMLADHPDNG
jgi:hypothetical protein